jgi:hypothetical protein
MLSVGYPGRSNVIARRGGRGKQKGQTRQERDERQQDAVQNEHTPLNSKDYAYLKALPFNNLKRHNTISPRQLLHRSGRIVPHPRLRRIHQQRYTGKAHGSGTHNPGSLATDLVCFHVEQCDGGALTAGDDHISCAHGDDLPRCG